MPTRKDTFLYLATCSHRSLGSFLLSRLNTHQQLKKELQLLLEDKIDRIAETLAEVMWADLLRDHGEEIMERLASPPRLPELKPQRIITQSPKINRKA